MHLTRAPDGLKPALRLIRANLFQQRFNVKRLQAALGVGAHDFTTEFPPRRRCADPPIPHGSPPGGRCAPAAGHRAAGEGDRPPRRLQPPGGPCPGLQQALRRAPVDRRELGGRLSPEVAADAAADLPPVLPRFLAGIAAVTAGTACGRCGGELETAAMLRVFEDLARSATAAPAGRRPSWPRSRSWAKPARNATSPYGGSERDSGVTGRRGNAPNTGRKGSWHGWQSLRSQEEEEPATGGNRLNTGRMGTCSRWQPSNTGIKGGCHLVV